MDELKLNEEKIKKDVITEMIMDALFNALKVSSSKPDKIIFESYKIDEPNLTYLLEKYDKTRFDAYKEMLLKDDKGE